jgi:hypothetical protein
MRGLINGLMIMALVYCGGCLAYKKAYVAVWEAVDSAIHEQSQATNNPVLTPKTPEADTNKQSQACSCDLTKPIAIPLVPYLGADDKAVNAKLYADYKAGIENGCGGLPGDVRPLLIRPSGGTFGYKHVILKGGVRVAINGSKMTVTCGDFQGQRFHIIGGSDHEAPSNGAHPSTLQDWQPITPGAACGKKHFIYLEAR